MGPLIPVILAIAAWSCSSRYGTDEAPIVADSGKDTPDTTSYADAPHVDLPNPTDGSSPDGITADLFAQDAGDIYGPDASSETDSTGDTQTPPDTQADVPVAAKFCAPKVSLPASCGVTDIAAGGNVSCLIKSGTVYCAGKIVLGVDPTTPLFNSSSLVALPSLAGATHIAVGGAHLCALMPGNEVKCLGQNVWGQLGDGTTQDAQAAVAVAGLKNVSAISLGGFHSLALTASGELYSWGLNSGGQLGLAAMPFTAAKPQIVTFPANTPVIRISAGALHSAATVSDSTPFAWGNNALFPLGVGTTGKVFIPMLMQNSKAMLYAAAGADFSLLLDQNCAVSAVGAGGLGQLGLGTSSDAATLSLIPSLTGIAAIVAGGQQACAVTQDGALFCWGDTNFGAPITAPTPVTGISSVIQTALGTHHSIALNASCQVFVWGKNNVGQLGLGNTTDAPVPTPVTLN